MRAEQFVSLLDKVRQTGSSRWIACCPAHEDKHPSMGVTEGDDGRILIICRAGCGIEAICAAVNVKLSDLMPEKALDHRVKPLRKPFPAADVLESLRNESMIVWLAGCDMAKGKRLTGAEQQRLDLAAARIERAING